MFLRGFRRGLANCPGLAPTDPQLGNLIDLGKAGGAHDFFVEQHKAMGSVFTFWWGTTEVISLGHPDLWKPISHLHDRPQLIFKAFEPLLGAKSTQYANGQEWMDRRKRYQDPTFSQQAVETVHYGVFRQVLETKLFPLIEESIKSGKPLPLHETSMKFALETICRSAIGYEISQETIDKLAESYDSGVNELTRRFKGEAPTPEREEVLQQSLAGFREVALEAVERRRSLKQDDQFGVFIDFLLHEDEEVIFSDLISFMVAGFHTSGTALFWAWDAIGRYLNVQDKFQAEIDKWVTQPIIEKANLVKMKYARNLLHETLRWTGQGSFAARVHETEDTKLNDEITIPAGMPIITPLGKVLLDPEIWDDAHIFNPDRFEDAQAKRPLYFSPFGFAGGRICPGRLMTYAEVAVMLGSVFKNYNMTVDTPTPPDCTYGIVTKPHSEVYGTFTRRN